MSLSEFLRGEHQHARGSSAESDGVAWLRRQGYQILQRNVASRHGEIDVVALESETLCFIEIKARRSDRYGSPAEAVTAHKQRRISRGALDWLSRRPHPGACRFDVLAMTPGAAGEWRFDLIRDAFPACT